MHAHGVPHRRIEEWKYSDLKAALGETGLGAVTAEWLVRQSAGGRGDVRPFPVRSAGLGHGAFCRATRNVMSAASLALSAGGVAFRVPKGMAVADPLKLDFTGPGHVRALLVLEEGASLTLLEGAGPADFRNVGFDIVIGAGASLEHVRISPDAGDAVLVEEANVRIAAGGRYRAHFAGFGSQAVAHGVGDRAGRRGRGRRICPASRCWTASATATSPPMSSIAMAIPTAASCSSMSRPGRHAPSIRAR